MNNPKIRKLFDEATFEPDRIVYGMYHPYIPLQISGEETRLSITNKQIDKFAQLIAKECASICETASIPIDIDVWENSTKKEMTAVMALELAKLIRKKFGVE